jgi:hypothetical protein
VAWTAWRMTRVTTDGLEMRDRCPALTSVMWAPALASSKVPAAIPGRSWCALGVASAAGQERCQEGAISLRNRIAPTAVRERGSCWWAVEDLNL